MRSAIEVKDPTLQAADQRVTFHGARWADYEILLAIRGESSVPRITYLEGELELMSPSDHHEYIKTTIARLVEIFTLVKGIRATGLGSWTIRQALEERGLEPDECYVFGDRAGKERPDLAIEVVWTSGGIDKLDVYRGLGIPEVWIWKDRRLDVHRLDGERYVQVPKSVELPTIDLEFLLLCLDEDDQTTAVQKFWDGIR